MNVLRPGKPVEIGVSPEHVNLIKQRATEWVADGVHPSLVILAARRGIIFLHEAFGQLTPEINSPQLPLDAIFPLASLTKPITATAAMILVEEGLLGLNRSVQEYLPEFQGENKHQVMVHHLLTHTSGMEEELVDQYIDSKEISKIDLPTCDATQHPKVHQIVFDVCQAPLSQEPGLEMSYCNYGYILLGEIVRRVSGKSLQDFASSRIFKPLGMKDTWYSVPHKVQHRIVQRPSHAVFKDLIDSIEWQEITRGDGGAFSTVLDMAIFGQMFLNHGKYGRTRVLSPATIRAMTCNQIPGIGSRFRNEFFKEADWGLGWSIYHSTKSKDYGELLLSPRTFCHGGAGGTFLWVDPLRDLVVVFFSVYLEWPDDGLAVSNSDLFINTVLSSIVAG